MDHKKISVLSCAAIMGLALACSKSSDNGDDDSSSTTGGAGGATTSQVCLGCNNTAGTAGMASTSSSTGPVADNTVDGTQSVDQATVTEILEGVASGGSTSTSTSACQGVAQEIEATPSLIYFLVDVSSSMLKTANGTGTNSKWVVTRDALIASLSGIPATFGIGIGFYPNMDIVAELTTARDASYCVNSANNVALSTATDVQRAAVSSALSAISITSREATPTHDAYKLAVSALTGSALAGNAYIALITDGQPTQSEGCIGSGNTCYPTDTAPIISAISDAYTSNLIQTFVVGSPGSEKNDCTSADVREWLSEAASAGKTEGTAGCADSTTDANFCHFDLTTQTNFGVALSTALTSITQSLISCEFAVPENEDLTEVVIIYYDGTAYKLVLPTSDGTCANGKGWAYTDSTKTKLQICSTTCALLQASATASINIVFGCGVEDIPIR